MLSVYVTELPVLSADGEGDDLTAMHLHGQNGNVSATVGASGDFHVCSLLLGVAGRNLPRLRVEYTLDVLAVANVIAERLTCDVGKAEGEGDCLASEALFAGEGGEGLLVEVHGLSLRLRTHLVKGCLDFPLPPGLALGAEVGVAPALLHKALSAISALVGVACHVSHTLRTPART